MLGTLSNIHLLFLIEANQDQTRTTKAMGTLRRNCNREFVTSSVERGRWRNREVRYTKDQCFVILNFYRYSTVRWSLRIWNVWYNKSPTPSCQDSNPMLLCWTLQLTVNSKLDAVEQVNLPRFDVNNYLFEEKVNNIFIQIRRFWINYWRMSLIRQ